MGRIFGLFLLLGLVWLILRQLLPATRPNRGVARESESPRFEKTVRCARCGVHLPMALARREHGHYICLDTDCTAHGEPTPPDATHTMHHRKR